MLVDGRLRVPDGPGLGVHVDLDYLEGITTGIQVVKRREGRPVRVGD